MKLLILHFRWFSTAFRPFDAPDCCVASHGKGKLFLKEEEKLNERLMEPPLSLFIVFSDCSCHSSVRSKWHQPLIRMGSAISSMMTPRNRIKVFPRINHAFKDARRRSAVAKQLNQLFILLFQQRLHPRIARTHATAWRSILRPVLAGNRISFPRCLRRRNRETLDRKLTFDLFIASAGDGAIVSDISWSSESITRES